MAQDWIGADIATLNASARIAPRRDMPEAEIEQLHVLARRFHLLPTRVDYAKSLWLNGRMAEAENELQIIRGVYHPAQVALIERDWCAWKAEHRGDAAPHPPESAMAPASCPASRSTRP